MFGIDPRAAKIAWTVFLVGLGLYLVYAIRTTILLIVFSVFFAYLLFPLVRLVDRHTPRRFPRTATLALSFFLVFGVITVAGAVVGNQIVDEASRLATQLPTLLDPHNLSRRIPLPDFLDTQRDRLAAFISEQLRAGTGQALPFAQQFGTVVMHTAGNLIYLVLVPILSFLLIKEGPRIAERIQAGLSRSSSKLWVAISGDLNVLLSSYVRALILLALATLLVYGLALAAFGVPYAALLAGAAALLEVIPVVGPLTAAAAIIVTCLFSGFPHTLWVLAFIIGYRLMQDYALAPYLMGKGVEISSLMVILGLVAGEELGGIAGVFLSVPVIAAIKIILVRIDAAQPPAPTDSPPPARD
ncbi:AI-2E family transporter [Noviherbaspirillum galbum]|uniref:AI-2E family transporter n=1 Tax=Noviherbaspirillum galbum TaxID=2709383 RepID=A0A6B3SUZ9_9BURK|nr:AI-2E family transporter [Noviherbaspirillum galbum]NEX64880.1 AI-2E family transporter [Noviherbaspirillum galbum]